MYPGPFEIIKRIRLPKYIANGDYLVDIDIHQPSIQTFLSAPNCQVIHIEGFYEPFALPLVLKNEGFLGLESE